MKKTSSLKRILSLLLCIVLIAAMALTLGACTADKVDDKGQNEDPQVSQDVKQDTKQFEFVVVDADGNESKFDITTDKETVGEALLDKELIAGEDSEFGLYVKTVNGITADYDTDGTYWAFYINGEYASTGVDSTEIVDGATYMFKVES